MLRVAAIMLALAVSFDYFMLSGKYISAAQQMGALILQNFK